MKPLKQYKVYIDYETKIIEVEALNSQEAEQKALGELEDYTAEVSNTETIELNENGDEIQ